MTLRRRGVFAVMTLVAWVTTQGPETGTKDWDTLTQIAKYRPKIPGDGGLPFGMYATVERPGTVDVGDEVVPQ